jgi:transposase
MIPVPTGVRVWLATEHTDMRRGFPGLSLQVQEVLKRDPLNGHLFVFRGRKGDLLRVRPDILLAFTVHYNSSVCL